MQIKFQSSVAIQRLFRGYADRKQMQRQRQAHDGTVSRLHTLAPAHDNFCVRTVAAADAPVLPKQSTISNQGC